MKKTTVEIRQATSGPTAYAGRSRVRVSDIARRYQSALDDLIIERIQDALPTLSRVEIEDAIVYWREHPAEIEKIITEENAILERLASSA